MAHGGKREAAGRKLGSFGRITQNGREMANQYSEEAFSVLVSIMRNDDIDPKARLIAAKEILDRAHGKPTQYQNIATKPAVEHVGGLSKEAVDMIKRKILGIYDTPS
jgi:hypothetical protein